MIERTKRIWKGWLRERLISLPDQKRQVLTIRKPLSPTKTSQRMATHHAGTGMPQNRWTVEARKPAAAGMGMPTKYFRPGRPGLRGCASWLMLKRASRETPPMRNKKQMNAPACCKSRRNWGLMERSEEHTSELQS